MQGFHLQKLKISGSSNFIKVPGKYLLELRVAWWDLQRKPAVFYQPSRSCTLPSLTTTSHIPIAVSFPTCFGLDLTCFFSSSFPNAACSLFPLRPSIWPFYADSALTALSLSKLQSTLNLLITFMPLACRKSQ